MKVSAKLLLPGLGLMIMVGALLAQNRQSTTTPPSWAYGFTTQPGAVPKATLPAGQPAALAPDPGPRQVSGSKQSFTLAQIKDLFSAPDWFPEDHPTMPLIVARGKRDADVNACGYCHYPNGKGRPENASLAGLPHSYIVQTLMDFKNDKRKSSDSRKANTNRMISFAKAMTDDEIKEVATYFSSMTWTPWIRVVETDTVPKTRVGGGMFLTLEGAAAGTEPIGQRIIETPEKTEETEVLRNSRSGFVAYVPKGSVKKGEVLVSTGAGKTTQCTVCHGANLEGRGPVPGLAGRSPSYVMRQLYDIQQGARHGEWTELMKPVVEKLTVEDMLNIAAYTASRTPGR